MNNKFLVIIAVASCVLLSSCQPKEQQQPLQAAIIQQLDHYPESRLQDIYKSFYQDHFGPKHLISDPDTVRYYLYLELSNNDLSSPVYYEPTGSEGRFVRVFFSAVADSLISAEELMDAFMRSANEVQEPQTEWIAEWSAIVRTIREDKIAIENFEADVSELTEAARNSRAVYHSRAYNAAYHPHYRIVERGIFEKELRPKLVGKK